MDCLKVFCSSILMLLLAGNVSSAKPGPVISPEQSRCRPLGNSSRTFDQCQPKQKGPEAQLTLGGRTVKWIKHRHGQGKDSSVESPYSLRRGNNRGTHRGTHRPAIRQRVKRAHSKKEGIASVRIGKVVIISPAKSVHSTVNLLTDAGHLGRHLAKKVLCETHGVVSTSLRAVKCVQYPAEKISVLTFRAGHACVVDSALNATWYLTAMAGKRLSSLKAWALYMAEKVLFKTLRVVIDTLGWGCIKIPAEHLDVFKGIIDKISFDETKFCGWANLVAVNNVTITKEHRIIIFYTSIELTIPVMVKNVVIHFFGVNVTSLGTLVLENVEMEVRIKTIHIEVKATFHPGRILRFLNVKMRLVRFDGFTIRFPKEKRETLIEEIIESMSDIIGSIVIKAVNDLLAKFERELEKFISIGPRD